MTEKHNSESSAKPSRRQSLPTHIHDLDSPSPFESSMYNEEGAKPSSPLAAALKYISSRMTRTFKKDSAEDDDNFKTVIQEEANEVMADMNESIDEENNCGTNNT